MKQAGRRLLNILSSSCRDSSLFIFQHEVDHQSLEFCMFKKTFYQIFPFNCRNTSRSFFYFLPSFSYPYVRFCVSSGARHRSSHFINSSSFHPAQSSGPFLAFISTICSFFLSPASPLYSRRGSHLALTPAHPSRPPPAFHSPGLAFHQSLPSSRPPLAQPLPPFQPFSLSTFI